MREVAVEVCSFEQERIWFLNRLHGDSPALHELCAAWLDGPLNIPTLQGALRAIVHRHETLRTLFRQRDGQPYQVIWQELELPWREHPLPQSAEPDSADRTRQLLALAGEELARPFDIEQRPPWRVTLMPLHPRRHLLVVTLHHLLSDGEPTARRLLIELAAHYSAATGGGAAVSVPELPLHYRQYARRQRQQLVGESLSSELAWWRQELAGAPQVLELPIRRPRPSVQTFPAGLVERELPAALTAALRTLAQQAGTELGGVLLAALQAVLHRYTGEDDFLLGTPLLGRAEEDLQHLIGYFGNPVALRARCGGDPTFRELLLRTRQTVAAASAHGQVSFKDLVEALAPQRSLSHPPLVQVLFAAFPPTQAPLRCGPLTITPTELELPYAAYEQIFTSRELPSGLSLRLQFNRELLAADAAARLLEHWAALLDSAAHDPGQRLSQLTLLAAEERNKVLVEWNSRPAAEGPAGLHDLFTLQARRTPDAIAVTFGQSSLTYQALAERATDLAHHLRGLGIGRGALVGICVERSFELAVGILAILQAGAAYLPIDPSYPQERVRFMLEDAAVPLVLTQARLAERLPAGAHRLLLLDGSEWESAGEGTRAVLELPVVTGRDLAYVIYTSGSTGLPKGAMIEHRNIVNTALAQRAQFQLQPGARVLQFASLGFDACTWELAMALTSGATLCLPEPGPLVGEELGRVLTQHRISIVSLPPSILSGVPAGDYPELAVVIACGEVCSAQLVERWAPGRLLVNAYGPTECAICATLAICQPGSGPPTIGTPLPGVQVYILEPSGQPAPIGVPAELYIGGAGVGRGYLNRPELSAERFLPDPFAGDSAHKLYRSGDRARLRPDGSIEFLGRLDQQIKLRGFRIELGEVEQVLRAQPGVQDAAVLLDTDRAGEPCLIAYVVGVLPPEPATLTAALHKQLPDYMVPSAYVPLQTLPLTAHGKLDRRALPAWQAALPAPRGPQTPLRTPQEEAVAAIWQQVLGIVGIAADDNFFALGGHSLRALQVLARVRQRFQVSVSLRQFMAAPTIAGLSHHIASARRIDPSLLPATARSSIARPALAQERLWLLHQLAPQSCAYNYPAFFRLRGTLDVAALQRSLQALSERHEPLRTTFDEVGGLPVQVIAPGSARTLPVAELPAAGAPAASELALRRLLDSEAQQPFDLRRGPLFRAQLVRLRSEEHVLLLSLHHIITDGWSMGVLYRELGALYAAHQRGVPAALPPLPLQYADYALWHRQQVESGALAEQLAWWTERLAGAALVLDLPTDRPRPLVQTFAGATVSFAIDRARTAALRQLAADTGTTLTMVLLAAFFALLHRYTGQEDILVGFPHANRERVELEGLVGFFVNTLVIRGELAGAPTFLQLLARVRAATLEAHEHAAVPFERLVQALHPERELRRNPVVQVMFAPQLEGSNSLELAGLTVEPAAYTAGRAPFELTLYVWEDQPEIAATFEYNTALFERDTIERMAQHLGILLGSIVSQPERSVATLPMLSAEGCQRLLRDWNNTRTSYPRQSCVHTLFEEQARLRPTAVAARCGGRELTYGELNRRANRLAHALIGQGVDTGTTVGLFVERSLDMLVCLLAILKAGGAYVPLDPDYPIERLRLMLSGSSARYLLAAPGAASRLDFAGTLIAPTLDSGAASEELPDPPARATATSLAYVMFTSGSTGTPQGVAISHRAIVRLVKNTDYVELTPADRVLHASNLSFDASTFELWGALLNGGCVVIVSRDILLTPPKFADMMHAEKITALFLTTALFNQMAHECPESFQGVRYLLFGGELCDPERVRAVLEHGRPQQLLHVYGPTENTTFSTWHPVREVARDGSTVPIGRPIANTTLYILDPHLQPVPPGVAGEIYVGGDGVAIGYLNQPARTSELFLSDPFTTEPDGRLYKTGDRARFLRGGVVEFLGRKDHQIKIRGFRVEVAEIEAMLAANLQVRDVTVVVRKDRSGNKRIVAYVVPKPGVSLTAAQLRGFLKQKLPDYMIPASIVLLAALPVNANGKVDQRALSDGEEPRSADTPDAQATTAQEQALSEIWREVLGLPQVGVNDLFFDIGGHSLLLSQVRAQIRDRLHHDVDMLTLFQYPSIRALAAHLSRGAVREPPTREAPRAGADSGAVADRSTDSQQDGIAIIGYAGRFPGADNAEAMWTALMEGRECITRATPAELRARRVDERLLQSPAFVPALGRLANATAFDAEFFGYSIADARLMDPQQRLFLECAWEAFEHAGHDPSRSPATIGVFGGASIPRYWLERLSAQPVDAGTTAQYRTVINNSRDFLATRVAHKLGLRGPALNVQAACATSLVAVHLACQSLQLRQCDLALAGGVSVASLQDAGYVYEEAGVLARDGHCRPFDAEASGFVPASGVALVVLRRLADALRDGDTIHAVIRGSAVSNDGAQRVGFTAPSVEGQCDAITRAQQAAGVSADSISYIEAHGTATQLGDPIEVAALTRAFQPGTTRSGYCALSSLKSNFGHLDAAAGTAGLIKTALALENQCIPGTVHFQKPNPTLELASSPFFVTAAPTPWPRGEMPRRAGVSAFGLGGTNAHIVLQEAPVAAASSPGRASQLLILSARTPAALAVATRRLAEHLVRHPATPLADVAYTLQQGRRALPCRRALSCSGSMEAAAALAAVDPERVVSGTAPEASPELVFMFPGGGTQQIAMGQELYAEGGVYRAAFDRCASLFATELHCDLGELLFPAAEQRDAMAARLLRPSLNMATIFATEYALAQLLLSWGLRPAAVIGHSLGEYAAACVAGVLTLPDAVALVSLRGRLSDEMPASMMVSVAMPESELVGQLGPDLSIAAVNGVEHCVVSGTTEAVNELVARLLSQQIETRRIPIAMAAHSVLVEPFAPLLSARAAAMQLQTPSIPWISNVTGTWMSAQEAQDPTYWARHLRQTIRFADGLTTLLSGPARCLVEVGPGKTLSTLARIHPRMRAGQVLVSTLAAGSGRRSDLESLLHALGSLFCAGVSIDWAAFSQGEHRRRVPLPTYPFERREFMIESNQVSERATLATPAATAIPPERLPRSAATLAVIWKELLGVPVVNPTDNFFTLGGSSLLAIELRTRVKELLQTTLPVHVLVAHPTFAALASEIERLRPSDAAPVSLPPRTTHSHIAPPAVATAEPLRRQPRSWMQEDGLLVCLQPGWPGQVPLVLFQSVGGTVYVYKELAARLGPGQPVYAFRASGMEPGEPIYSDIPSMVARYLEELLAVQPWPYFLLGGYSSGGAIAYEMASQLIARGYQVPFLFLADSGPAGQYERMGITTIEDLLRVGAAFEDIAPRQWQALRTALHEDSPLHEVIVQTYHALTTYRPKRSSAGIVYFRASERDDVLDAHPETWWMDHADGPFTVHNVPGHHLTMMEPPYVKYIAQVIRENLRQWRPKSLLATRTSGWVGAGRRVSTGIRTSTGERRRPR